MMMMMNCCSSVDVFYSLCFLFQDYGFQVHKLVVFDRERS